MYSRPPTTFEEIVAPFPAAVRETAAWIRALIMEEFPQVEENIYGGVKIANALYSVGGADAVALGIQPGPHVVKLFIHDPEQLRETSFKLEGSGKHMRHIKLSAPLVERREELVELLRIPIDRRSKPE